MDRRQFVQLATAGAGAGLLGGVAPASGAASAGRAMTSPRGTGPAVLPGRQGSPDVIVVGAGAFGGWTAYHLSTKGVAVTLLDAYGPGNSRSSSGGETRLMQVASPGLDIYVRTALRAYTHWTNLQESTGEELLLHTGRLAMYRDTSSRESIQSEISQLRELGIADTEVLDSSELRYRWPQIRSDDVTFAMFNPQGPGGSTLMARKGCQVVAREVERAGGQFRLARAEPVRPATGQMQGLLLNGEETITAQQYVFACGPWLAKLFPELLAKRLQVQRRDVIFHGVPPGDHRFSYPNLPEWSVQESGWYGFPDIENRGLKAAPYPDLNTLDPDTDERLVMPQQVKRAHDFLADRFPALEAQPVTESRVCQVTNSADSNFIVDRHPEMDNVWIVGGGSGHGFKHGPAVGEYVAQRIMGEQTDSEYDRTFRLKAEEPF